MPISGRSPPPLRAAVRSRADLAASWSGGFQQIQVRVTGSPRLMLPAVSTEAYTPTLTALRRAAVRRISGSLGRSPCGRVIMTQGAGCGDGKADVAADRRGVPDPVVLGEALVVRPGRHDDVGAEAPGLEAPLRVLAPQVIDRGGGQQMHHGDVEERPGRHVKIGHGIPVVQASHVRPVFLGRGARGPVTGLGFLQGHVPPERARENPAPDHRARWSRRCRQEG